MWVRVSHYFLELISRIIFQIFNLIFFFSLFFFSFYYMHLCGGDSSIREILTLVKNISLDSIDHFALYPCTAKISTGISAPG